MKFRVTAWVVIEDVLYKPGCPDLELDEAVATPLVARDCLVAVDPAPGKTKSRASDLPKADTVKAE